MGMGDLGAQECGFRTVLTAEIEPFCRSVLRRRFPHALHFDDVRDVFETPLLRTWLGGGWSESGLVQRERNPLLVSGGFPCQDLSRLGAGGGLDAPRSGLYAELLRIVGFARPEYVMIENVSALRTRGLGTLLTDLYYAGYDVRWDCIPAAFVGAPHLRDRIFIGAVRSDWAPNRRSNVLPSNKTRWLGAVASPSKGVWSQGKPVTRYPRSGHMLSGLLIERDPLATVKQARARTGALWPTPRAALNEWRTTKNSPSHASGSHGKTLAGAVNDRERHLRARVAASSESAGNISPRWVEWLMGLPQEWTNPDVKHVEPFGGWSFANEPSPRTEDNAPYRASRLKALGNGLVPQAFSLALSELLEW